MGPGLITAGLVIGAFQQATSPLAIALVAVGLLLTIISVSLWGGLFQRLLGRRSTQAGTDALIATLSLLVILGLLNGMAVKYPMRWDFTETRLFTLAPQTQKLVGGLNQPLKVWIFEPTPNEIDRELLESYRRLNGQFSYEYIDPQIEIALADRLDVQTIGEVYLEYDDKSQLIQTLREGELLSEVQLTNGVEKILRDRQPEVYFLQGHGELPFEPIEGGLFQAINGLKEKGYDVRPLDLTELDTVPQTASVVVIASPKQTLLVGEVKAIADYVGQGGSTMLLLDPETTSGLEPLLAEWGISMDGRLVIDASGVGANAELGPATPVVTDYGTHPITLDFQDRISFYPLSQSIILDENVEEITTTPLVLTTETSWAEQDLAPDTLEFDPEEDLPGPLTLAVAATRPVEDAKGTSKGVAERSSESKSDESETETQDTASDINQKDEPETRLVVFGNATFASNGWFEQQLNGDIFLNSIKWLANEKEELLSIRPKSLANRRIALQPGRAALLTWLALVFFPILGFLSAVIVWWRDR